MKAILIGTLPMGFRMAGVLNDFVDELANVVLENGQVVCLVDILDPTVLDKSHVTAASGDYYAHIGFMKEGYDLFGPFQALEEADEFVQKNGSESDWVVHKNTYESVNYEKDAKAVTGVRKAKQFWDELLMSFDTLSGIADTYSQNTLVDMMYLQMAILKNGFIDHYPEQSSILEVLKAMPSGREWVQYLQTEHGASPSMQQ